MLKYTLLLVSTAVLIVVSVFAMQYSLRNSEIGEWNSEFEYCTSFRHGLPHDVRIDRLKRLINHNLAAGMSREKISKINSTISATWSYQVAARKSLPTRPAMISRMHSDLRDHFSLAECRLEMDRLLQVLPEKDWADVCLRSVEITPAETWFEELKRLDNCFAWLTRTDLENLKSELRSRVASKIKTNAKIRVGDYQTSRKISCLDFLNWASQIELDWVDVINLKLETSTAKQLMLSRFSNAVQTLCEADLKSKESESPSELVERLLNLYVQTKVSNQFAKHEMDELFDHLSAALKPVQRENEEDIDFEFRTLNCISIFMKGADTFSIEQRSAIADGLLKSVTVIRPYASDLATLEYFNLLQKVVLPPRQVTLAREKISKMWLDSIENSKEKIAFQDCLSKFQSSRRFMTASDERKLARSLGNSFLKLSSLDVAALCFVTNSFTELKTTSEMELESKLGHLWTDALKTAKLPIL